MTDRAVGLAIALVIVGLVVSFVPSVFQGLILLSVGAILTAVGMVQDQADEDA